MVPSQSNSTGRSQLPSATVGALFALAYLLLSFLLGYALLHAHGAPDNAGAAAAVSIGTSVDTSVNDLSTAPTSTPDLSNDILVSGPDSMTTQIPKDWTQVPGNGYITATDPNDSSRSVFYGADTAPSGDLLSDLTSTEQTNTSNQTGYLRLRLESVSYHGSEAADWEFEYTKDGVTQHVASRWWVESGIKYWIEAVAPADRWPDTAPIFGVMTDMATP